MDRELLEWFCVPDEGDMPELHLVGLTGEEVLRAFDAIAGCDPRWSGQTFHVDAEGADYTVDQRPDVARLVVDRHAGYACIGASLCVGGVRMPEFSWFMHPDELQFYWDPGADWTEERVKAFFVLVKRLLAIAPGARLLADPRYTPRARAQYDALVRRALEDA